MPDPLRDEARAYSAVRQRLQTLPKLIKSHNNTINNTHPQKKKKKKKHTHPLHLPLDPDDDTDAVEDSNRSTFLPGPDIHQTTVHTHQSVSTLYMVHIHWTPVWIHGGCISYGGCVACSR